MPRPQTPKAGTVEWQLWKLKDGESVTRTTYVPMENATPKSLTRAKSAARSYFTNNFKGLQDQYGRRFTTRQYSLFDESQAMHVIFTVITALSDAYKYADDNI